MDVVNVTIVPVAGGTKLSVAAFIAPGPSPTGGQVIVFSDVFSGALDGPIPIKAASLERLDNSAKCLTLADGELTLSPG